MPRRIAASTPMFPADLPLKYKFLLRSYRWRRADLAPAARLRRRLTDARVALVASAGFVSRYADVAISLDESSCGGAVR